MYDIFYASTERDNNFRKLQERFPLLKLAKYESSISEAFLGAKKKTLTNFFWVIDDKFQVNDNFDFDYKVTEWDTKYVHVFKQKNNVYGGIYLIPKDYHITKKEAEYKFFINKKEIDTVAGCYLPYDRFTISKAEDYIEAQKNCKTSMFYAIDENFIIDDTFDFDYPVAEYDKKYVHVFKQYNGCYGGILLIPKDYRITSREAEYKFFINKKEIDVVAGKYPPFERFTVNSMQDYVEAQKKSKTSMFYAIDKDFILKETFDFDYPVAEYDKKYVHVFKQENGYYGGVHLFPKNYRISSREEEYDFFNSTKEIDVVAGTYPQYDIVFISYNEPNADENYEKLLSRFPNAKRVHGVKGIHQAHIAAAKLCETSMFWVVDGDAVIEEDFNFVLEVNQWSKSTVYVHQSRNPINGLVYGYGGVKFLPRDLVLAMDVNSVDMTTSISKRFNSVERVSNITAFNTDPFSTWKSAFRECVKLSSRIIEGQVDIQTQNRLNIWCTVGEDKPFGEYAIKGAIAGRDFGQKYSENPTMLSKINDWKWLENEFRQ